MPTSDPLRLSAKGLGDALPGACPRCLWVSLRFDLTYQRFPGVFGTIDRFTKNVVHRALDDTGRLPPWFPEIGRVASYERDLSYKRFRVWHEDLGVDLAGSPDDVFRMDDGSLHIVDYKTARLTPGQSEYLPIYEVQLNAYAYLAERIGLSPVRGLSLIYMEPNSERDAGSDAGPAMPFEAKRVPVELKPDALIPPLLAAARSTYDLAQPPSPMEGCKDCVLLDQLLHGLGEPD